MTYIESNIKRQMAYYDKLYEIGGRDVINDVWVRADGEREWWFVGKIARVSGEFDTMLDVFLNIYMLCQGTSHHIEGGGGPDQAAWNILLGMKTYHDVSRKTMSDDGWAAQLGTTGPQIAGKYGSKLVDKSPLD